RRKRPIASLANIDRGAMCSYCQGLRGGLPRERFSPLADSCHVINSPAAQTQATLFNKKARSSLHHFALFFA
ncbi:hypothetical protein, partial [Acidovorax sp. Q11]